MAGRGAARRPAAIAASHVCCDGRGRRRHTSHVYRWLLCERDAYYTTARRRHITSSSGASAKSRLRAGQIIMSSSSSSGAVAVDYSPPAGLQLPTVEQVEHISQTWAAVKDTAGLQKAGELFFHSLFEAHPEALGLFTKFKDEPKWQESAAFKAHALRVISTVDTAFGMLGDLDQLVPILQRLGRAHVGYGAQSEHYDWVGAALVATLQAALGPKMTDQVTEAYVVVYTVVKTVMLGAATEIDQ